jgi:hypothetical protein
VTRKLRLLDLGLVAVLALLGTELHRERVRAHAREQALLYAGVKPKAPGALTPLPKVEPLTPTSYADIAAKNLFSKDRNPNVILDPVIPPPEKPVPPFPVARGVMLWGGVPPTVVLSDKPGGQQRGYHPGEKFGEWKIESIDNSYVIFEWNGKEFKKRIDELLDRTPIVMAEAPAQPAAGAAAPKPAQSLAANGTAGPGIDTGAGLKGCVPGDNSPSGTVVGGFKKVVSQTPFGVACQWETVK